MQTAKRGPPKFTKMATTRVERNTGPIPSGTELRTNPLEAAPQPITVPVPTPVIEPVVVEEPVIEPVPAPPTLPTEVPVAPLGTVAPKSKFRVKSRKDS